MGERKRKRERNKRPSESAQSRAGGAFFASYLKDRGLSPGTIDKYCAIAGSWQSAADVRETLTRLSSPDTPPGSVLPVLGAAKHWCAWRSEPMPNLKVRWRKQRRYTGVRLTRPEAKRFLKGCPKSPGRFYARFVLETGLRGSSLSKITADLCGQFARDRRYILPAKGGKLLTAPLTEKACKILRKIQRLGGFPSDPAQLRYAWRKTRAGYAGPMNADDVQRITLHTFRHVFASDLIRAGAPREAVQEILGHASYASTDRYVHDADVDAAMALLEGR